MSLSLQSSHLRRVWIFEGLNAAKQRGHSHVSINVHNIPFTLMQHLYKKKKTETSQRYGFMPRENNAGAMFVTVWLSRALMSLSIWEKLFRAMISVVNRWRRLSWRWQMLRFSLGLTRMDRIRNDHISGSALVGCFWEKVAETKKDLC